MCGRGVTARTEHLETARHRAGRRLPQKVTGVSNIVAIATGYSFSLALKDDGTLWAWGRNNAGQLGDGTTTNRTTPIQVPSLSGITQISAGTTHSVALQSDGEALGTVWSWGRNNKGQLGDGTTDVDRSSPIRVAEGARVISASHDQTLFLEDGFGISARDLGNGGPFGAPRGNGGADVERKLHPSAAR